jgi:DNA-binding LacI/PurR family transcriptional regulator
MRVTQQDIARIANVSQATVSRVVSGDEKVENSIRDRVLEAMRHHNYQPDVRARSLRNSRAGLIGLVVNRPHGGLNDDPFFASLTAHIIDYLQDKPYHLCLEMAAGESKERAIYDEMLRTRRVDGLILVESEARDSRIERLQHDNFPFVLLGNPLPSGEIHSVDNDNIHAAELATSHLLDSGYRRVGILGARTGVTVSDDRITGYQRAIRGRQEDHLIWHADFGSTAAREAACRILAEPDRPDALVVLDDLMAMGVVLAARGLDLNVPEDLGLVSFNDTKVCDLVDGGLSSVSLNIDQIVKVACDRLLRIIERRPIVGQRRLIVPTRLKIRGSSIRHPGRPVAAEPDEDNRDGKGSRDGEVRA